MVSKKRKMESGKHLSFSGLKNLEVNTATTYSSCKKPLCKGIFKFDQIQDIVCPNSSDTVKEEDKSNKKILMELIKSGRKAKRSTSRTKCRTKSKLPKVADRSRSGVKRTSRVNSEGGQNYGVAFADLVRKCIIQNSIHSSDNSSRRISADTVDEHLLGPPLVTMADIDSA